MKAENYKAFTYKNLHYSTVESAPRLLLMFFKVEKIVRKNICFVHLLLCLFLCCFLSFFSITHNSKLWSVYKCSTYATNALVSEIFVFWFRAVCKLWLVSYGPKHASQSLSDTPFCAYFKYNSKTTSCLLLYYTLNDSSHTKDALFHVKSGEAVVTNKVKPQANVAVVFCAQIRMTTKLRVPKTVL